MIAFCSQANVLREKVRIAIERIRLYTESLRDKPEKQRPRLNGLNITLEENKALLDGLVV